MTTGRNGHTHHFDSVSGWCSYVNCTVRDDGRLIDARPDRRSGRVLRPGYPDQQKASSTS